LQSDRRTGLKKLLPNDRSESLFYYFRIEDQVPESHLLRFIDRYVSFDFVREKLRASYSETGRPSIDPEVLLRILLLKAFHSRKHFQFKDYLHQSESSSQAPSASGRLRDSDDYG
jgi:transposase